MQRAFLTDRALWTEASHSRGRVTRGGPSLGLQNLLAEIKFVFSV